MSVSHSTGRPHQITWLNRARRYNETGIGWARLLIAGAGRHIRRASRLSQALEFFHPRRAAVSFLDFWGQGCHEENLQSDGRRRWQCKSKKNTFPDWKAPIHTVGIEHINYAQDIAPASCIEAVNLTVCNFPITIQND